MSKLSYRRLFAWAVLCCTLTALCGLGRSLGLACLIACIFACPLFAFWHKFLSLSHESLKVIVARLLLLLMPLSSFIYASSVADSQKNSSPKCLRHISSSSWFERSQPPAIRTYLGKKVVLTASIERVIAQQTSSTNLLIVSCKSICFPEERVVDGSACLVIDSGSKRESVSLFAEPSNRKLPDLTAGDLISVACFLRSMRFAVPKNSVLQEETRQYLDSHKRQFDTCSIIVPQDLTVLSRLPASAPLQRNPLMSMEYFHRHVIAFCREQITDHHKQALGQNNGALLTSMVLGQNAVDLPKNIVDSFRDVGLSHIVAASGFNLTVVILVTYWLLRPFNLPNNTCEYACLFMMATYVALSGISSSIARAALMSTFILLSRMTQRRVLVGSALAAALIITWLPSPQALLDVGLQLSYVATVGIIIGARSLGQWLNSRPSRFLQQCADTIAVTVVAQLSVLPIQLYYFGTIGLTFLAANVLVVPLVAPITMLGFVASLLILMGSIAPPVGSVVQPLVNRIDQILQLPLTYIIWLTSTFSGFQWAKLQIKQPSISAIAIYYACIVSSMFLLRFPDKKLLVIVLVAAAIACLTLVTGI